MKILYGDLETFSTVELKCGTHAYAEKAEVLLFPYAIDDDEPQCWDVTSGAPMPDDLASALQDHSVQMVWHNGGMFDLTILNAVKITPRLPHSRVFDTMACAYAHALPGGLEILGNVLGIAQDKAKHKTGKKLIQLFCKPLPKNSKLRRATSETHPIEWQQFIEYGKADITAMREVYKKIPKWNYQGDEYQLWLLDQRINQRGVAIDLALARGAVLAADKAKGILAQRAQVLTEGEVASATKRDAMIKHIFEAYGIPMPDMQMATLERRIADPDIPEPLKELLQVRLQASTSSVSKFNTLLKGTSNDGRFRGLLQFAGAGRTGRWCLAEGSAVKVRDSEGNIGERPIEDVRIDDEVWDGEAWVRHEGVVFSGDKEVITHDGVTATPEHKVYLSTSECVTLAQAKNSGRALWRGERVEGL